MTLKVDSVCIFYHHLMRFVYRMFNTTTNSIQSRVTKMYSAALQAEKSSLATHYGAIVGLTELGAEVCLV